MKDLHGDTLAQYGAIKLTSGTAGDLYGAVEAHPRDMKLPQAPWRLTLKLWLAQPISIMLILEPLTLS
jgi:hypothetical protein